MKDFFTTINGKYISVRFISSGLGSADYGIQGCRDLYGKPETRVKILDSGKWEVSEYGAKEAGLTQSECFETLKQYKLFKHDEYIQWHNANKERMNLGDPEPMELIPANI